MRVEKQRFHPARPTFRKGEYKILIIKSQAMDDLFHQIFKEIYEKYNIKDAGTE